MKGNSRILDVDKQFYDISTHTWKNMYPINWKLIFFFFLVLTQTKIFILLKINLH